MSVAVAAAAADGNVYGPTPMLLMVVLKGTEVIMRMRSTSANLAE